MSNKEEEYKEIFLAEALENFEEINRLLTQFEKNNKDLNTVHALFRITHTLKGNAAGMGFTAIAEMAHVLEDLFGEVREGRMVLTDAMFTTIFKAVDVLGSLINSIRDKQEVKYKGIKTKLEVLLKRAHSQQVSSESNMQEMEPSPFVPESDTEAKASHEQEATLPPGEADAKISFSDLVQVPVRKLDNLLNLVGELIIEKDRILATQTGNGMRAANEFARLSRISADLQYSVMDVRMVQVGFLFNKFHRVVRDAAAVENKNVVLKLEGTDTEIDRNVLQVMSDSLIHLIRNAVAHGIEEPEVRKRAGKPREGTVWLSAQNSTDAVVIEIRDDGAGLNFDRIRKKAVSKGILTQESADKLSDAEISDVIFEPGFSTMDQVTAMSGRGVGMDVVKKTLESIGGTVKILSEPGKGTTMSLTMPSSMAVKSCLLLELQDEVYAIPLSFTESVMSLYKSDIFKAGGGLVASHLGKNIAIVFLQDVFELDQTRSRNSNHLQHTFDKIHPEERLEIVVVTYNNRTVGFVVDKLLQQKEIVEKPLMRPVDKNRLIGGVTILGNGKVCLVLNVPFILNYIFAATLQR